MSFAYQPAEKHKTLNAIYTPTYVSEWLHKLTKHLKPAVVLDPACGEGSLLKPWCRDSMCLGVDNSLTLRLRLPPFTFAREDFLSYIPPQTPDLVVCNPPWSGAPNKGQSYPYLFLRRIVELYGPEIPIIFLCPMGFTHNQKMKSKRRQWFLGKNTPEISSVVSCPIDLYPNTLFHSQILLFNIKRVKSHYWCPNPPKETYGLD